MDEPQTASNRSSALEPLFSFEFPEGDGGSAREGLAAGAVIAGWRIVRRIAGGAASAVYEAERADGEGEGSGAGQEERVSKFEADFDGTGQEQKSTDPKRVSGAAERNFGGTGQEQKSTDPKRVSGTAERSFGGTEECRVAIKVFDRERMDESALRRFRLHATALGGLAHPGLVGVVEWGVDPVGRPYLVMPLVEGVTFDVWLASDARPDAATIVEAMAEAAEAVGRAHVEMGMVHRDVKPSNVMVEVDAEGRARARVIDFGVAMVHREAYEARDSLVTRGGAVVGTPAYMAPEQMYAGSRAVDARADVYALGVMLYEALTGRRPVRAEGLSLVEAAREKERVRVSTRQIRRQARAEGFEIAGATAGVIAAALSPDPEDRQADGAALASDLRRALRGAPARHRGPGAVRRFRRFLARERKLGAALIALFATLTVSAGVIGVLAIRAERARRAEQAQTERMINMVRSWTHGGFLRSFNTPGSEPALIAVTEAVIHALEEACAVRPKDIDLADHLSFAYAQLASVVGAPAARSLGDEARARELHDRSIAVMERSAALYREQRPEQEALARLSIVRAIKRRVSVTPDAAERRALMDRALAISSEVFPSLSGDEQAILSHAGTLAMWADEHEAGEARADACERAVALVASVAPDSKLAGAAEHQRLILHLGIAGTCAGWDAARARRHLDLAAGLLDARVGGRALDPIVALDAMLMRLLARVEMIDAQIALTEGDWDRADTRSAACVEGVRPIAEADPGSEPAMLDLATRLRERGEILLAVAGRLGTDPEKGEELCAEAAKLAEEGLGRVRGFMPERPRTRHEVEEIAALERVLSGVGE